MRRQFRRKYAEKKVRNKYAVLRDPFSYPCLILKDSYWRLPERNLAGNAIDFHVQVLDLSFHDAMRQITGT
jgi:hypothetical protein